MYKLNRLMQFRAGASRPLTMLVVLSGMLLFGCGPNVTPTVAPAAPTAVPATVAAPTAAPTLAPVATATVAPTVAPTSAPTVAPTRAATTVAPTSAPTAAPTRAPTTASPTLPPPTADVIFQEDFSGKNGYLGVYGANDGAGGYVDGYYQILITGKQNYIYGATISQTNGSTPVKTATGVLQPAAIDVDITGFVGPGNSNYGIACGWNGESDFYALFISNDGRHYSIDRVSPLAGTQNDFVLVAGQERGDANPVIVTGIGAKNHLHAECGSNNLSLSVNGTKLVETPIAAKMTGGVALIGYTRGSGGMEVHFDNLVVRKLAAEPTAAAAKSGQIIFRDDFASAASGWPVVSKPGERTATETGTLHITLDAGKNPLYQSPLRALSDLSAEMDITQVSGDEKGYAGLTFRDRDTFGFYDVIIGSDGVYAVGKSPANKDFVPLIDYTDNAAIKKGLNQVNHLRVDVVGPKITVTINGTKVGEVSDADFKTGYIQIEAGAPKSGPAEFKIDNFVVTRP